jgi:hypothetical protein
MKNYKYKLTTKKRTEVEKTSDFTNWLNELGSKGLRVVEIIREKLHIAVLLEKEVRPKKKEKSEINPIIELFNFNPAYTTFYSNTNQRKALETLVKEKGENKVREIIKKSQEIRGQEYAPKVDTPCQLRDKFLKVEEFKRSEGSISYH